MQPASRSGNTVDIEKTPPHRISNEFHSKGKRGFEEYGDGVSTRKKESRNRTVFPHDFPEIEFIWKTELYSHYYIYYYNGNIVVVVVVQETRFLRVQPF